MPDVKYTLFGFMLAMVVAYAWVLSYVILGQRRMWADFIARKAAEIAESKKDHQLFPQHTQPSDEIRALHAQIFDLKAEKAREFTRGWEAAKSYFGPHATWSGRPIEPTSSVDDLKPHHQSTEYIGSNGPYGHGTQQTIKGQR